MQEDLARKTLELSYIAGGVAVAQAGETLGPRTLRDYECVLLLEGSATHAERHLGVHAVPTGGILLTRPGFIESYTWAPERPTRHAYFHFHLTQIPADWPLPESWPVAFATPVPAVPALYREIVGRIHLHPDWPATPPDVGSTRLVETMLSLLLCPQHGGDGTLDKPLPAPVMHALQRMRQSLDATRPAPLRLATMARTAGVTPKHLCALFAAHVGHPPHRTWRLLQLHLALALLTRSELSIKEIAQRCHFQDPYYFSRYFSSVFHVSPSQVRQRLQRGEPLPHSPLPPALAPQIFW